MRIACLHLPGFPLQAHARSAPGRKGSALAVLGPGAPPRVAAVSRRAAEAGVATGMTAPQARAAAPEVALVNVAAAVTGEAMAALGDAALAVALSVDIRQEGALYAIVPPRAHGFGEKLLGTARTMGFVGRVGIADDRFTAWAATQATPHAQVRTVAAGGSAAFLATLPLGLLPLDPDIRRMLERLGVGSIGDFAALPPPSVGRPPGPNPQALARGHDRTPLEAHVPRGAVREELALEGEVNDLDALSFALRRLLDRVALRLEGRGCGAARLSVRLGDAESLVTLAAPTRSGWALLDAARAALGGPLGAVSHLAVTVVAEGEVEEENLELFGDARAS